MTLRHVFGLGLVSRPTARSNMQQGATLVELLIGMAVSAIVLTALFSVAGTAWQAYQPWAGKLEVAETNSEFQQLAVSIQADGHRYVVCATSPADLPFCAPGSFQRVATYSATETSGRYQLTRTDEVAQTNRILVRDVGPADAPAPVFTSTELCSPGSGSVQSGSVTVTIPGRSTLTVYLRGPVAC